MNKNKMHSFVPGEYQRDTIDRFLKETGMTVSELVRRSIDQYLKIDPVANFKNEHNI